MITRLQADELGDLCEKLMLGPRGGNKPDGTVGGFIDEAILMACIEEMRNNVIGRVMPLVIFMQKNLGLVGDTMIGLALALKRAEKEDPYHGPGTGADRIDAALDVVENIVVHSINGFRLDGTCPPDGFGVELLNLFIIGLAKEEAAFSYKLPSVWRAWRLAGYVHTDHDGTKVAHFLYAINKIKAHGAYLAHKATTDLHP